VLRADRAVAAGRKYAAALLSQIPRRNGWTIAEHSGDRTPDRTQRLLNRAVWDTFAAMGVVRRFAVAGLNEAARKTGRRAGLAVGAIDETGQVKAGACTAGVKRQYLGCVGKVANGINTVHLSYVREGTGHALIGAREWIPAAHLDDPAKSLAMGLPEDLAFRTKGQLAIDILAEAFADGVRLDFVCGDEYTARAPNCADTAKTATRPTCCGSPPASASPWPAGSRSPASRPPPGWAAAAAGRSAPPGRGQKATAGTPGRGWPPPPGCTTC
jgi:SRSO17 transposase